MLFIFCEKKYKNKRVGYFKYLFLKLDLFGGLSIFVDLYEVLVKLFIVSLYFEEFLKLQLKIIVNMEMN